MPQWEPMPLTRRVAWESVWALGCVLAVVTLYVTVISNMEGGPHSGPLDIPPSAWAVLWDEWLRGHFLVATAVVYGLVQAVRFLTWAVTMDRLSN